MTPLPSDPRACDPTRRRLLVGFVIAAVGAVPGRLRALESAQGDADGIIDASDWQAVLQTMFPHEGLDAALYGVTATALVGAAAKDPATGALLGEGWRSLNRAAGGSFRAAPAAARTSAVASIVGTPFFTVLRQTTVFTFYANPTVWEAFGYDGDAWRFGGWLGKGVDTIDWLPKGRSGSDA